MSRYQPDRKCPHCEGAGVIEIAHGPGACADSHDVTCSCCDGNGSLDSTHERYAEATRWPVDRRDPLLEMRAYRAHYLIQRRMPWGADQHPYKHYRKAAMKLVDLPIDDGHLLVTPETAAYFNALTRRAA